MVATQAQVNRFEETTPETLKELLTMWDDGQTIWAPQLGGLGPGYDQAIMVATIEFAREALSHGEKIKRTPEVWAEICDHVTNTNPLVKGISGAMYGVAKWLAARWYYDGPRRVIQDYNREGQGHKILQYSRHFPGSDSSE